MRQRGKWKNFPKRRDTRLGLHNESKYNLTPQKRDLYRKNTLLQAQKEEKIFVFLIPRDLQISPKHWSVEKSNVSENGNTLCLSFKFATQVHVDSGVSLLSSQVMLNQDKNRRTVLAELALWTRNFGV